LVTFKNRLEEVVFQIAKDVCAQRASVEHNKVIEIEATDRIEVATFSGPPKKEIDVVTAGYEPNIKLLISCMQYGSSKAEPSDVQEWGDVIRTLNKYSKGTSFLGLIVSPSGFTAGCEGWATSSNLSLIPPMKGKQLSFEFDTSLQMVRRVLSALAKRLTFPHSDLLSPPGFYNFVYDLTKDFEGRDVQKSAQHGGRYVLLRTGWLSSFGELVATLIGRSIVDAIATTQCLGLRLSEGLAFRVVRDQIQFGTDDNCAPGRRTKPLCMKNLSNDHCTFDFIKDLVRGQRLTSAGDFGSHFEFGLSNEINLGFHPGMLHVVRTRNPIELNVL